jgi:hypothetical protein
MMERENAVSLDNLCTGKGRGGHGHQAILQINYDEGSGCCNAELFAEIGYEAATNDCYRRAKEISALNYWSALKACTRRAPQGSLTLNLAP